MQALLVHHLREWQPCGDAAHQEEMASLKEHSSAGGRLLGWGMRSCVRIFMRAYIQPSIRTQCNALTSDMECMRYGVQSAWATAVPKEFNDEDALLAQRRRTKAAHTRDNAAVHSVRHSPGGIAESKHARSSGGTKNNCSSNGSTRGKIVGGTSIKKKLSFVRAPRSSKSKNSNERPTKAKYGRATSSSKHKGASRDVDVATNAAGSTPKHVHANATTSMSLKTVKARVDSGRRFKTRIFLTRL